MRQSWETMTSVSAGHIILTSTQPVASTRHPINWAPTSPKFIDIEIMISQNQNLHFVFQRPVHKNYEYREVIHTIPRVVGIFQDLFNYFEG